LFVAQSRSQEVWLLDTRTYEVKARVETGSYPHTVTINPITERAYVVNYLSRDVTVLDARTGTWLQRAGVPGPGLPRGIAVDPATNRVYVTARRNMPGDDPSAEALFVLDGETLEVCARITVGALPSGVVVHESARRVYVANPWSDNVSVVDADLHTLVATIAVDEQPGQLALDGMRDRVYVTQGSHLAVIDCRSNSVVASLPAPGKSTGVAVDTERNRIYVTSWGSDALSILDGDANSMIRSVAVGRSPNAVALTPSGDRAFIANLSADALTVIDTAVQPLAPA
jgi:YVTN family beta-propeller protein